MVLVHCTTGYFCLIFCLLCHVNRSIDQYLAGSYPSRPAVEGSPGCTLISPTDLVVTNVSSLYLYCCSVALNFSSLCKISCRSNKYICQTGNCLFLIWWWNILFVCVVLVCAKIDYAVTQHHMNSRILLLAASSHTVLGIKLQDYYIPFSPSPKWPILCRVGR